MGALIDTSILIAAERGQLDVTDLLTIGAHDLLIAATALAIDWQIVTRDERSFPKIPGLSVIKW